MRPPQSPYIQYPPHPQPPSHNMPRRISYGDPQPMIPMSYPPSSPFPPSQPVMQYNHSQAPPPFIPQPAYTRPPPPSPQQPFSPSSPFSFQSSTSSPAMPLQPQLSFPSSHVISSSSSFTPTPYTPPPLVMAQPKAVLRPEDKLPAIAVRVEEARLEYNLVSIQESAIDAQLARIEKNLAALNS